MEKFKPKLKQATIKIQFREWADLRIGILDAIFELKNGVEFIEKSKEKASYTALLEFIEKTDYTEKQINEIWYRIAKSKI